MVATAVACASPPAVVVAPTPTASTVVTAPEPALEEEVLDARTRVLRTLEPGVELHAGPVSADDGSLVAWVGRDGVTRARLTVGPGDDVRAEPMPRAARVVSAFRAGKHVVAVLETLAALDQPAGVRGLDATPPILPEPTLDERVALSRADEAAVRTWLAGRGSARPNTLTPGDRAGLAATLKKGLGALVSAGGVDELETYQGRFSRVAQHLSAEAAVKVLRPRAFACGDAACCDETACTFFDDDGAVAFLLSRVGDELRATRIASVDRRVRPVSGALEPRRVDPFSATERRPDVLVRAGVVGELVAQAPTGRGGSIGVVRTRGENAVLMLIEEEGPLLRALPLLSVGLVPERLEVAFADLDADGRTDVVLGSPVGPPFDERQRGVKAWVPFLVPRTVDEEVMLFPDVATAPLMFRAASLDAAVSAALRLPPRPVTLREVCPMIQANGRKYRRGGAGAVPIIGYTEPGSFAVSAHVIERADLSDRGTTAVPCSELTCDRERPVCVWRSPPAVDWYTFGRDAKGKPVLIAAVGYTGS
jgi:hypothetical protein